MCSTEAMLGEMLAIMTVRACAPTKESLSTAVSLLPRNGTCLASLSSARMHSLSASRLLLISAPSSRVWRLLSYVSAPRSLPARSMNEIFPTSLPSGPPALRAICMIECDREESALAAVLPVLRCFPLSSMSCLSRSTLFTPNSLSPTTTTRFFASSRIESFFRP